MGAKRFSASLAKSAKKTNNHPAARRAKVEIRRNVLEAIGEDRARVFDAFAGEGDMHGAVWCRAAHYVGCDLVWYRDDRLAFAANNERVLRAIDLTQFNVFDFDAYGSPWYQVLILADRRPVQRGEMLGLVLTEGSGFNLKMGGLPRAMSALAGLYGPVAGGSRHMDELINMVLAGLCRRMNVALKRRWQAHRTGGADMRYLGLILEGI